MLIHRSRSANTAATTTTAPNAGRFQPIPDTPAGPPHADDDLIVVKGAGANRVGHRSLTPDGDPRPACPAGTTSRWERFGAYRARPEGISLCREMACFPRGWAA